MPEFPASKLKADLQLTEVTTDADSYLGRKVRNPGFPKQAGIMIKVTNIDMNELGSWGWDFYKAKAELYER